MKRFQFQLAPVLDYKQQVLDGLMAELGALQEKARQQEQRKEAALRRQADYDAEFAEKRERGLSVLELVEYEGCQEVLAREVLRETLELEKALRKVEDKRREVVQARQETFSLEKLRDIRRKEYDSAVAKAEEKTLDDLTASRRVMAANA